MRKTTRLKKPQIPELDTLYQFDDLGGRPKYGGVEMTSATDIPSFEEIQRHVDGAIAEEAAARGAADDDLEEAIGAVEGGLEDEIEDRAAADNNLQSEIDVIVASSDVKDIVGTKADLNNYDTSTLGDNDIIKVLQDETQQDQTTYYRWGAAAEAFTLIGAEGPYYTKAATNNLLNAKADKTAIGTPKKLTANDYNWNSNNKSTSGTLDSFALWLLEDGLYNFETGTPISKLKTDKNNSVPGAVPGSANQAPTILIMSGVDAFGRTIKTFFGVASQGANPDGKSVFFAIGTDTGGTARYNAGGALSQYGLTRGDVVNDLNGGGTDGQSIPLSARQGNVLNGRVTTIEGQLTGLEAALNAINNGGNA